MGSIHVLSNLSLISPLGYVLQIAGRAYENPTTGIDDIEDLEERFDPEKVYNQTDPTAWNVLTYLGNIGTSVLTFIGNILFIFTGVYNLIMSTGAIIKDVEAYNALHYIAVAIQTIVSAIMGGYIVQLIVGRRVAQ